jgi:hypothetical protein
MQYRVFIGRVQGLVLVFGILMCCSKGANDQMWQETPGFKKREMIRPRLSGMWIGDYWDTLTISYVKRDSVVGTAKGGAVSFRGEIRGIRADIACRDKECNGIRGYVLRKVGTDSLFVGLKDSTGMWRRFFPMIASDGGSRDEKG